ncbi:hypothetical protein KKC88_03430 [Patescibacteria group bacterium]|nr:hypothetical protein [Patescibacteria group bacterium]MBU1673390.1 hypothetical protein [Patescibacteria group bacterium]MBU1963284.1 hypothetical protein [Patescibacteria group bacterium]
MAKERKASWDAVAALISGLSREELLVLIDHPKEFRQFATGLVQKQAEGVFVEHIHDKDVPERLQETAHKWRRLAAEWGYTGPVAWRVKAGFTLKQHASQTGPCREDFQYLQDWKFEDEPTPEAICFWIPRLVPQSTSKNVDEQMELLTGLREQYNLPDHHLANFGSAALQAALILSEFKRSGDRVPQDCLWTRTDALDADGLRLRLGFFDEFGLSCGHWVWHDCPGGLLGCFALGVDLEQ